LQQEKEKKMFSSFW